MTPERLVFLEDGGWRRLWPLTATRPVCDLRYGAWRLFEKTQHFFGATRLAAWAPPAGPRAAVTRAFVEREGAAGEWPQSGPTLWWNGAALPQGRVPELPAGEAAILRSPEGRSIGLWDPQGDLSPEAAWESLQGSQPTSSRSAELTVAARFLEHLWDLLADLEQEIARDLRVRLAGSPSSPPRGGVWILGSELLVADDVRLEPGCVLDTRQGPIFVDRGARIESLTHVVGPAYVGRGTQLLGGRILHTSFGPECRVGGEVEATIFQGYANKRHQGFLGHAVVGEWVNLGAMTSNSDLKNNYGTVPVWEEGHEVDTRSGKVGCFLGDHVKTGIGTLLSTGAVVGPGSNLFAGGRVTPRFLPGWSWWDGGQPALHEWSRFLSTARLAMGRRGVGLTADGAAALLEAKAQGPRP